MMFELEALEEMIAGKCSVSAIDDSSTAPRFHEFQLISSRIVALLSIIVV